MPKPVSRPPAEPCMQLSKHTRPFLVDESINPALDELTDQSASVWSRRCYLVPMTRDERGFYLFQAP